MNHKRPIIIFVILTALAVFLVRKNCNSSAQDINNSGNEFRSGYNDDQHNQTSEIRDARYSPLTDADSLKKNHTKVHSLAAGIREAIENADNPNQVILDYFKAYDKLDTLGKRAFEDTLENNLAELDLLGESKFSWIAENLPNLEDSLISRSSCNQTILSRVYMLAMAKCYINGAEPITEINNLSDPKDRTRVLEHMLPHIINEYGDKFNEELISLPLAKQNQVVDEVIKLAVSQNNNHDVALRYFLNGKGSEQMLNEVNTSLLKSEYFWNNSPSVTKAIESSPPSNRRDLVVASLCRTISRRDPNTAQQWLEFIDDIKIKESILVELNKKSK